MARFLAPLRFVASVSTVALAVAVTLPVAQAQINTATFKNFKRYPTTGQWSQELVGYRDNKPLGPPVTSTTCSGPLDPETSAAMLDMARQSTPTCTTRTIADTPSLIEYENLCNVGGRVQTIHSQVRAVDDRTMQVETRSSVAGMPETLLKSKVTYLGACPAGAAPQNKPSAEDCAQIAAMRASLGAGGGAAQCAGMPAAIRAQCEAQIQGSAKIVAVLEAQCR